jgi:hypothetical protein
MGVVDLGSLVVPEEFLRFVLGLEDREMTFQNVKGTLRVSRKDGTPPELSEEDRAKLTRWKLHLLALLDWMSTREDELTHRTHALTPPVRKGKSKW